MSRTLPHNLEAERAVLGAVLRDPLAIERVRGVLAPQHFYTSQHQKLFLRICQLADRSPDAINVINLNELLIAYGESEEVGGWDYLCQLEDAVPTAANISHWADIIRGLWLVRQTISTAHQIVEEGFSHPADPIEYVHEASHRLFKLSASAEHAGAVSLADAAADYWRAVDEKQDPIPAVDVFGFPRLNKLLGGLKCGALITVAGITSHGKTALALSLADALARDVVPVLFCTYEMRVQELLMRLLAMETGIAQRRVETPLDLRPAELRKLREADKWLRERPLHFLSASGRDVLALRSAISRAVQKQKVKVALIDYLQLIPPRLASGRVSKEEQIGDVCGLLKDLALRADIPIVLLSQVSREAQRRLDERNRPPTLGDLKYSSSIEQVSDQVLFVYQPQPDQPRRSKTIPIQLIVAKNRLTGRTGTIKCELVPGTARLSEAAPEQQEMELEDDDDES